MVKDVEARDLRPPPAHTIVWTVCAVVFMSLKYIVDRLTQQPAGATEGDSAVQGRPFSSTAAKMLTGRYADYFNDSDTSDVKVVVEVAKNANLARSQLQLQGTACKSANAGELRAHSLVLMGNSPVWKAQLERWQGGQQQKTITIIVEEGEQAAAYRLIQCLYTDCLPDIETEADLRMTLGILMLADQYEVEAALAQCTHMLETLTNLGAISWALADFVMQLPAAFLENPGLSCLVVKIQEKILKHVAAQPSPPGIGLDLEVVTRTSALEEGLMALPLRKCASLLSDDRCRVASENTVAAAVVRRVRHEGLRSGEGDAEHVQAVEGRAQIMGDVVRVQYLSVLFAAAFPTFASQLTTAVRPEIYAFGRELDHMPADFKEEITKDPSIPRCWLSGRRPTSIVTALEFDWEASIAELAKKFDSGTSLLARSPKHFFAGMDWEVTANKEVVPNEGCTVGIYVAAKYPLLMSTRAPRYGARMSIEILGGDTKSSLQKQFLFSTTSSAGKGWSNFFDIPPMEKWDESRMQKWTSSGGFLTVRVKVSDVM